MAKCATEECENEFHPDCYVTVDLGGIFVTCYVCDACILLIEDCLSKGMIPFRLKGDDNN
jgi:hypothetical protein